MDIKGTATEKNLWTAFAGESQTRNKYVYFAKKAEEEGYDQVGKIFRKIAQEEEEHAKVMFQFLNGIKDTRTNLKLSAQNENYEATTMYEEYEKVALEEGFPKIANFFREVAKIEKIHEEIFTSLLMDILDK